MRLTNGCFILPNIDVTVLVVPGGDTVPPPKLSANAPVLDITHPREVGVFPLLGDKFDGSCFYCFNSRTGQFFRVHVPLQGQPGLNHHTRPIPSGDLQAVILNLLQQTQFVHRLDYRLSAFVAIHPSKCLRNLIIQMSIGGEDINHGKLMTLAHRVIVEVMCWRDFDAA